MLLLWLLTALGSAKLRLAGDDLGASCSLRAECHADPSVQLLEHEQGTPLVMQGSSASGVVHARLAGVPRACTHIAQPCASDNDTSWPPLVWCLYAPAGDPSVPDATPQPLITGPVTISSSSVVESSTGLVLGAKLVAACPVPSAGNLSWSALAARFPNHLSDELGTSIRLKLSLVHWAPTAKGESLESDGTPIPFRGLVGGDDAIHFIAPPPPPPPLPPSPRPPPPPTCATFNAVDAVCELGSPAEQLALIRALLGKGPDSDISYCTSIYGGRCATNSQGVRGFYAEYNGHCGGHHKDPIHLLPGGAAGFFSSQTSSSIEMSYVLQGSDENSRCTSGSWVPLNGPGYNGGYVYDGGATCPSAFSCIQGSSANSQDAPISASYSNAAWNFRTTLLTWSGSSSDKDFCGSCSCSASIPTTRPALWFTKLEYTVGNGC